MKEHQTVTQHRVNGWIYENNDTVKEHSPYKLHVALDAAYFHRYYKGIHGILLKAVEDGIIPSFKMLDLQLNENSIRFFSNLQGKSIQEEPNLRLFNNPFTIYLYPKVDIQEITNLCNQLEKALNNTPEINENHLSLVDLTLSDHITFRQETLDGKRIKVGDATQEQLTKLASEARESKEYTALKSQISEQSIMTGIKKS